jgi:hypothetical protein
MSTNKTTKVEVNQTDKNKDNMFSKCYGAEGALPKISEEMKKFIRENFVKENFVKENFVQEAKPQSKGIYSRWKVDSEIGL